MNILMELINLWYDIKDTYFLWVTALIQNLEDGKSWSKDLVPNMIEKPV